jgi:hypothetical protein
MSFCNLFAGLTTESGEIVALGCSAGYYARLQQFAGLWFARNSVLGITADFDAEIDKLFIATAAGGLNADRLRIEDFRY